MATQAASGSALGSGLVAHTGQYTIENWQLEQGLPQITVTSIAQTPDGYLWVGTFNGLARFDGVQFTIFNDDNTPALGSSAITQLQVDEEGALWMVTLPGRLVRLAAARFTVALNEGARFLLNEGGASLNSGHPLYLLDGHGDRRRIANGRLAPAERGDPANSTGGPRFLFENTCLSWVARPDTTRRSHKTTVRVAGVEGAGGQETVVTAHSAAAASAGGYWLATHNGLYRLTQDGLSRRVAPLPAIVRDQLLLKEDGDGALWAGKWGEGLFRLNADGSWLQLRAGAGLADAHVTCLYRDREGSLWVGTGQGGLHRVRPRLFQMFVPESGPKVVMSLSQDQNGRVWAAVNGGGLHTWADGRLAAANEPALLRQYPLTYSVLAERHGGLWAGIYGFAALQSCAGTVKTHGLDDGSGREMTPHALFEDRNGTIWLGCAHGLLRYDGRQFTRYTLRDGLSCDTVRALAQDRAGTLYIGTDGGGLNRLCEGRFTCFSERDGLADDHVAALLVDGEDTLWIGTANGGLSRFKKGCFASAGVKDGLPTGTIGTLIEDDFGSLWFGSNRGIIRVNRSVLNDYLDGKRTSVPWQVFGLSDGLTTLGCAGAGQPASCKTSDGRLWFASIKGVAVVDPRQLPSNPLPPPVAIEEVVVDDQVRSLQQTGARADAPSLSPPGATHTVSVSATPTLDSMGLGAVPSLTVPPRTHQVEFRFTGLSLVAPEKVRFRYRLDPFDQDWVQAGTRRIAYYTGIPPGRYQFRVTACNNDGVWNETGAALGLAVLPPWWNTGWFSALMGIGAVGLVFGWYELRLLRLRRDRVAQENFSRQLLASQEQERRRIAGELHDGMGQDLLVIASQAQLSLAREENSPGAAARLKDIAATARQALQQARRMAHNLRPGLIEELGLTKAIRASADKAAHASGVVVAAELTEVDGLLPAEFEVNLFRITQEALNNLLKHAGASEARIILITSAAVLRLVVEDNGRGFEPDRLDSGQPNQGLGLRQITERAKMMGGRVELQSRSGTGTRLIVEVPLPRSKSRV